jgi:DNA helicase-2/ATP-dependent DNA helicase PcrA
MMPSVIPPALGRGVVVAAGGAAPDGWADVPRAEIDDDALRDPGPLCDALQRAWAGRVPVVVDVRCDVDALRAPETCDAAPYTLSPRFEFARERLYFLARANNYDHRHGRMSWTPVREAQRLGASARDVADVALPDGTPAWLDGGPRAACVDVPDGHAIVHRNQLEQGSLLPDGRGVAAAVGLADDQREAVLHDAGPTRVIAPAGSGKTRVLTERMRLLLEQRQWHPAGVTAVAYNVRAKDTMRDRLAGLPDGARNRIRTLHSLGNDILRRAIGNVTVLDEWEIRRRIEGLVPVKPRANTDVYAPYLEALGAVRLGLAAPAQVEMQRDDIAGFAEMFDRYRAQLWKERAIDHDEQIYGALEVLLRDPGVRGAVQRECRHLLVDEFQDLTPAQLLMLRLVAAPAYDVFGVGDDDQVIYGYAGADPEFLINYDRYFPGGTHHALHVNYRCPPAIVGAARNLLSYNRRRIDKEIVAGKDGDDPSALTVDRRAAARIAVTAVEQVGEWLGAGVAPEQVAVLSRVNAALLPVQVLFDGQGVPCWTPVSVAVLNRTGTRTALAYLRLALTAGGGQVSGPDIATAVRRPSRSIRREVLQRFERRRRWTLAQVRDTANGLNATAADKLDTFCDDIEALARAIDKGDDTAALLTRIGDEIGLGAALATLDLSGKGPDASHRDDLNALIAVATSQPDPAAFEPWLRSRLRAADEPARNDGVAVSTVHRVKGMEWPYVVVLGAHDGSMPHILADDLEEERRIFHVAITRADTAAHVIADQAVPAPFLDEIRAAAPSDYVAPVIPIRRAPPEPKKMLATAPMTADLAARVDAMKSWRKKRAHADGVPAYVVLNDTHLAGIATAAPTTLEALARCTGIGPTKLERYGDEIIAVITEYTR